MAPDVYDDEVITSEETPITFPATDLLSNDTDADGDVVGIASMTVPSNGTLVDNGDGTYTYTPDPGFSGIDSFSYTATDGLGATSVAIVNVTVETSGGGASGLGEGTIRGRAFDDADQDGIEQAGEVGLQGLFVFLYDQNDNLIAQTQTDVNGDYQFDNVDEGTYYIVFEQPQDFAFTLQDQGTDDTIDSDVDVNGVTALFSLIGSEILDDLDAGLYWAA